MKRFLKIVVPIFVVAISFCLGYFVRDIVLFGRGLSSPRVHSDSEIHYGSPAIPEKAYRIYRSARGFVDVDNFTAFSADRDTIDAYLKGHFGLTLDSFHTATEIPESIRSQGPDSWDAEFKDENWDLDKFNGFLAYEAKLLTIIYVADQNRIFIHTWNE
jgi:hypothetical protein